MYNLETIIEENIAKAISDSADSYRRIGKLKMSKRLYLKALKLRERLSLTNQTYYQPLIAETLSSLAYVSQEENRYDLAIEYHLGAIFMIEEIYDSNPTEKYIYMLANSYTNMADLYRKSFKYSKAEFFYNEALKIYKKLPEDELSQSKMKLLNIYNHLSIVCNAENKFQETKDAYMGALDIYAHLVNDESDEYRDELGTLLFELGTLYFKHKHQNRAGEVYLNAIEILLYLSQKDANRYKDMLAVTFHNLAQIYTSQLDYANALSAYRASLKNYVELAEDNPLKYSPYIAIIFKDLALFYKKQNKVELAQYFHLKVVDSYIDLTHYNESAYSLKLVSSIIDGVTLYQQHTLSLYQAESILKDYREDREKKLELLYEIHSIREEKSYVY